MRTGIVALSMLLLCACGSERLESLPAEVPDAAASGQKTIYSYANGCYALQALGTHRWIGRSGDTWSADRESLATAAALFMKPTALGSYLLYDADGRMLGLSDPAGDLVDAAGQLLARPGEVLTALGNAVERADGGRTPVGGTLRVLGVDLRDRGYALGETRIAPVLSALAQPTDLAIWDLRESGKDVFELSHQVTGLRLVATPDGALGLASPPLAESEGRFAILPQIGCAAFPEAQLNAEILRAPKRVDADGNVFGWVDAHNHILGSEFLGGRITYGQPYHRLGITQALGDCSEHHGPQGAISPLSYLVSSGPHDTVGWPTFQTWPGPNELLHHQTYHLWMKRAFLAGQKLMVNQFVENEGLCALHAPINRNDCNEMASIRFQRQRLFELQDYIDAQEGGPGLGWFRIVTHPTEARQVIADGKMAVIMGAEVSKILDCGETLDQPDCTLADVRTRLDELHGLGLRSIFPIHRQDNAFGGAKPGGKEPINVVVAVGTVSDSLHGYRLEACAEPGADQNLQPPPGLIEELANLLSFLSGAAGGPAVPGGAGDAELCNARGLTPHGEYLIDELMRRRMLIEIDHSGERVRDRVLQLAAERDYPVVTAHSWTDPGAFSKIWRVGGALNMYSCAADCYVDNALNNYKARAPEGAYIGVGLGTDANGLGPLPGPRASAVEQPLQYPFRSYDGNVVFERQVTGERVVDLNTDGVAHYGLYADLAADIQQNGGEGRDEAMAILFRSAESYLRMWERAEGLRD